MKNIQECNVSGKKVLVRVDYNVSIKDGKILDDNRIILSLKTLNYLVENKAKIILFSHLGRIESEEDKNKYSIKIIAEHLSSLIQTPVYFIDQTRGEKLETAINNLLEGEILLMENTRFEDFPKKLESSCDEVLSKYWASLADIFVLDAFGSAHRCHASTYGVSKYIPSYSGFLIDEELSMLNKVMKEEKTLILGGSKVDDKIGIINNLIDNSTNVLIGGAMCFTFLKAKGYNTGKSIVSDDYLKYAKELLNKYNNIILPIDFVTQDGIKSIENFDNEDIGYDIGPRTIELFKEKLLRTNLVLWNGPLGKYEEKEYENGTYEIMYYLKEKNIKTILAGGDVVASSSHFGIKMFYSSTGGGSTLEYLEGKKFKTLERLNG